ncbi:MAG TPA: deoxyribodipyrimidine photo-lyase [Anaerolineae bacterium]|nr:deoxyribodipyrimidine photo-lyase [Anaerolineae bacterium]
MTTVIWWLRRDLRLHDNQALQLALSKGEEVIPLFILDPRLWGSPYVGQKRLDFLVGHLWQLRDDVAALGGRLILRQGEPVSVLKGVMAESGASLIVAERDYTPYAQQRDKRVEAALPIEWVAGLYGHQPGEVLKKDGTPYTVFTPFSRSWRALPAPMGWESEPRGFITPDLHSEPLPPVGEMLVPVGEAAARAMLAEFTKRGGKVEVYGEGRDRPAEGGTSRLSPYLRFGVIAAGRALAAARGAIAAAETESGRESATVWETELIWRDFYGHILHHFPHVRYGSFRPKYDRIVWRNDPGEFEAWCQGRTGYPIVDAGMRQMLQTGWMHNRVRMITASFLVKDLLIDWRWGERWFMQQLLDGDPASNNGGWQWTAGTGTDAAPYFRIFNPTSQGKKFDPEGVYVRQWVPELAKVPNKYIHEPWRLSVAEQKRMGMILGERYPRPIVEHKEARERTLAAYKVVRENG